MSPLCSTYLKYLLVNKFTTTNNDTMEFFSSYFVIKDQPTGAQLVRGPCQDSVYHLFPPASFLQLNKKSTTMGVRAPSFYWHALLGHPSMETSYFIINYFELPILNKSQVLGKD